MTTGSRPLIADWRFHLLLVSFVVQGFLAHRLDPWAKPSSVALSLAGGAPRFGSTVRAAADLTGLRVLVGHVFWFRIIQYYGDSENARDRYSRLFTYCSLAADLNPYYVPTYPFGAAPLAFHVHRPDEAIQLLERGIRANPKAVRLKLLLAAIGYQNRSEWDKVIPLLESQIGAGGAPTMLVNILANTYRSAGRYEDAIRLWRGIQKNASTDEERITSAQKLQELYNYVRSRSIPGKR